MPYLCFFIASLLVVGISFASLLVYLFRSRRRTGARLGVGILILAPAVLMLLPWLMFFWKGDGRTRTQPAFSDLIGRYTTTDSRAPSAVLDLRSDSTYVLSNFPAGRSGRAISPSGRWATGLVLNGEWTLTLDGYSGFLIYQQQPPFEIGLFIDDPDEGDVIFYKR